MMTIITAIVFALAAVIAIATIVPAFSKFRSVAQNLRTELASRDDTQVVRVTVCEWKVSEIAIVLRPDFMRPRSHRAVGHGFRAAA